MESHSPKVLSWEQTGMVEAKGMSKRKCLSDSMMIPPDPLKEVPKDFATITENSGFNVLDLVVCLSELQRIFGYDFSFTGPCEGSIHLINCSRELWISQAQMQKIQYAGGCSELRFSLSQMNKERPELIFLNNFLRWPAVDMIEDDNVNIEKILSTTKYRSDRFTVEEQRSLLKKPMPLRLRENFPYYTWPRWVFGVFEGLVMQRVNLKMLPAAQAPDA